MLADVHTASDPARPRRVAARPAAPGRVRPGPIRRAGVRSGRRAGVVPAMPGLDGLRALAVAAVFAYHAQAPWLPGGFLGVDVFFVVSGYLITSLLLCEHARTGAVSLRAFWTRRARRLLPALITVLLVTLALAAIWAPGQLGALRIDALAALAYVANWHDAFAHTSYFSQFGRPPLLRHLWSLSVEEQFYLVWPPLVILALRAGRERWVAALAVLLAAASALELWLLAGSASATRLYEGTDTRAATLLIGALAAVLARPDRLRTLTARVPPVVVDLTGMVTAAGLGWLMVTERGGEAALFRGPLLVASLLAAGLVVSVATPGGALGWLLARRPLVWLGRRSYGIYLWHWPVIALLRSPDAGFGQSLELTALQAAITVALAAAMYALIEQPIRRDGLRASLAALRGRSVVSRGALAAGVAGLIALAVVVPGRSSAPLGRRTALHGVVAPPPAAPPQPGVTHTHRPAPGGATRSPRPVTVSGPTMVFGDSVAIGTAPALTRALGHDTRYNAVVGRQPQDTVAAVAATAAAGALPARVVVSLGDNGVVSTEMLHALRRATRSAREVVLVTPRVPDPWGPPSAAVIRAAPRWWPGVRVADWAALSGAENGWFTDGVHPDDAGIRAYVHLLVTTLDRR